MGIICQKCKQPIQSKNDLIVMLQWWIIPRPLHKACWGELAMVTKGAGSVSYETGIFQNKKRKNIALNTAFYTVFSTVLFLIGLFVLFANIHPIITSSGQEAAASPTQIMIFKLIIFVVCLVPLLERAWSYMVIEKKL